MQSSKAEKRKQKQLQQQQEKQSVAQTNQQNVDKLLNEFEILNKIKEKEMSRRGQTENITNAKLLAK